MQKLILAPGSINFRCSKNEIFKFVDDKFVILEIVKSHEILSYIFQYSLKDQSQLYGCKTILSSISPVSFNFH